MSKDITDRPEYNPCPKCGDNSGSRRARYRVVFRDMPQGWQAPESFHVEHTEVLDIECYACGARLATVRPLDDATAPGAPA